MKITEKFSLIGFRRYNMDEQGSVFVRLQKQELAAEIKPCETNSASRAIYMLSVTMPKMAGMSAFAAVMRPSKNIYTAIAAKLEAGEMQLFKCNSAEQLRRDLNKFFEGVTI